jgi:hypothetical protein
MKMENLQQLEELQEKISILTSQLEQAKLIVQQWTDASSQLSLNAAEARAKNQGMGRGIGGALLGSKFRSVLRSQAAASNAAIAKDVANKRAKIAKGKNEAQELVRQIKIELAASKDSYRSLKSLTKTQSKTKSTVAKEKIESIDLLQKLKEAYDLGLLTDQEYELKRQKLVADL